MCMKTSVLKSLCFTSCFRNRLEGRHPLPHVCRDPATRARGRAGLGGCRARIVKVIGPVDDGVAVTRLVHAPTDGMPGRASGVVGTDVSPGVQIGGTLGWLGRVLGGTAVVLDEPVAYRCCAAHTTHVVLEADHLPECDGVIAAVAPAELRSFVDRGPAKDLGPGTRDFVAHAAAVAETLGEDVRRVDTVIVLNQLDHVIDEFQVLSAGIRPAAAEPQGRDEDRAVVRLFLASVLGHLVPIASAIVDSIGVAAIGVKREGQPVGFVLVVVVRKPHGEVPAATAALNRNVAAVAVTQGVPRSGGGTCTLVRDRLERHRRGLAAPRARYRAGAAGCTSRPSGRTSGTTAGGTTGRGARAATRAAGVAAASRTSGAGCTAASRTAGAGCAAAARTSGAGGAAAA